MHDILINLIATVIGGGLAWLGRTVIAPGLVELTSEQTKLRPHYKGRLQFSEEGGPRHEISVTIKKLGRRITGTLRFTEGPNAGQEYNISGRYSQGILTFTYYPLDRGSNSQGSATYQRMSDGKAFKGMIVYYSDRRDVLLSVDSTLNAS